MKLYQLRVVIEKQDLDEKISKLIVFIGSQVYASLPEEEKEALNTQLYYMQGYSAALGERIEIFEKKKEK